MEEEEDLAIDQNHKDTRVAKEIGQEETHIPEADQERIIIKEEDQGAEIQDQEETMAIDQEEIQTRGLEEVLGEGSLIN